uniref:CENP-V/GFA domain-containing protein n=1 Tax=Panagrellus redivivus TaxID=6233 RepID=A0A7E4W232_PANRE
MGASCSRPTSSGSSHRRSCLPCLRIGRRVHPVPEPALISDKPAPLTCFCKNCRVTYQIQRDVWHYNMSMDPKWGQYFKSGPVTSDSFLSPPECILTSIKEFDDRDVL